MDFTLCLIYQVSKPNIGESRPSQVRADVTINLNMRDIVKGEWEGGIVTNFTAYFVDSNFQFRVKPKRNSRSICFRSMIG